VSISSTGKNVVLCFQPPTGGNETFGDEGGAEAVKLHIYELSDDLKSIKFINKEITFVGIASFFDNVQVLLISPKGLAVYSSDFKLSKFFNLLPLISLAGVSEYPPNTFYYNLTLDSYVFNAFYMIQIAWFSPFGILLLIFETKVHVWSICDDGNRLTTLFLEDTETLLAISVDKRYIATFVYNKRS
jgi:hypothetical protein